MKRTIFTSLELSPLYDFQRTKKMHEERSGESTNFLPLSATRNRYDNSIGWNRFKLRSNIIINTLQRRCLSSESRLSSVGRAGDCRSSML